MDWKPAFQVVKETLGVKLFTLGKSQITIGTMVYIFLIIIALFYGPRGQF